MIRQTGLVIAAALTAGALAGCGPRDAIPAPQNETERQIDRLADTDPVDGAMFKALKANFPEEYVRLRAAAAEEAKLGAVDQTVAQRAHRLGQDFTRTHAADMAAAPAADLGALLDAQSALIGQLQKDDVQACADFGTGGLKPDAQLSPAAKATMADVIRLQVEAARKGVDSPVRHGPQTAADATALVAAVRAQGADERMIGLLFEGGLTHAPPAEQCAGWVALHRGLASLPAETGARFLSPILLRAQAAPAELSKN